LKRREIAELIDSLLEMRLVEQVEEERFRPTVQLTPAGEEVMRGKATLPAPLTEDELLLLRIKQGYKPAAPRETPASDVVTGGPPVISLPEEAAVERVPSSAVEPATDSIPSVTQPAGEPPAATIDIAPHSRPSHYWTWQLLSSGYSAEECQAIRKISEESLLDHLLRAAREGLKVDPRWILTSEQRQQLTMLFGDSPAAEIQPLLSQLPEGLRYRDVQFYLLTREN
jgi:ATP-dependent DNA helicase RecQ